MLHKITGTYNGAEGWNRKINEKAIVFDTNVASLFRDISKEDEKYLLEPVRYELG